eukprot:TRINITY_DN22975_c0_g1_i2.p1 TRINITY_DN22975_c0_g1~~TRINITY_DN22975_c0_g1_i2.p1  ORF type:complete len:883 (+),score=200.19 TRINITY_DN22975_c0_g1_i2:91-2649(+)
MVGEAPLLLRGSPQPSHYATTAAAVPHRALRAGACSFAVDGGASSGANGARAAGGPPVSAPPALKGSRRAHALAANAAANGGAGCRSSPSFSSSAGVGPRHDAGAASDGGASVGVNAFQPKRVQAGPPPPSREPQLLALKILYLSRVPGGGLFSRHRFLCSAHVGTEARDDPPPQPGRFSTTAVEPHAPAAVNPEEEALRQRIAAAVAAAEGEHARQQAAAAADGSAPSAAAAAHPPPRETGLECRFNQRMTIRLSEVGPGPSAGGPTYFRIDVWTERAPGLLGGEAKCRLFGRVFVPLLDPRHGRRPCTWPVVDVAGKDVAYLTCEFAFVCAPPAVRALQVEGATTTEVALTWAPPLGDSASQLLGYKVEVCALPRRPAPPADGGGFGDKAFGAGGTGAAAGRGVGASLNLAWQTIGELPATAQPGTVAKNLRGNTRYRFRVRAVSEAGAGDPCELEATTAPIAPSACGRPRLAGCSGSALSVEWDPPSDTGGVPLVAYKVWVRPYSASKADPSDWWETGQVRHREGCAQRADLRTEELNPSIARYLCRVAAVNAAGEVGPATPDAVALPFPNPCAICGPSAKEAPAPLANWAHLAEFPGTGEDIGSSGNGGGGAWAWQGARTASMTILEPGSKRPVRVPLHRPEDEEEVEVATILEPPGRKQSLEKFDASRYYDDAYVGASSTASASGFTASTAPQDWGSIPRRDAAAAVTAAGGYGGYGGGGARWELPSFASEATVAPALVAPPSLMAPAAREPLARPPEPPPPPERPEAFEDVGVVARRLHEKKQELEESLERYKLLTSRLCETPEDLLLRRSHEEAEVEAAGFQAEVAVLAQRMQELSAPGGGSLRC